MLNQSIECDVCPMLAG